MIDYNSGNTSSTDSTTYIFNAVRALKSAIYERIEEVKKFEPPKDGTATKKEEEAYKKGYLEALTDITKIMHSQNLL